MTGPFHSYGTVTVLFGGPDGLTGAAMALPVPDGGDLGPYGHRSLTDYDGDGHTDLLLDTDGRLPSGVTTGYALYRGGPEGLDPEPVQFTTGEPGHGRRHDPTSGRLRGSKGPGGRALRLLPTAKRQLEEVPVQAR
ncbi:hypothetical protein ACWFMI_15845 [Nocardiopsis terrae]